MGGMGSPLELIVFSWERNEHFCDVLGCPRSAGCPPASVWPCQGGMQWLVSLPSSPCPRSQQPASSPSLCKEDPLGAGSLQVVVRAGTGIGDPSAPVAPNLGWGMRKNLAGSTGRWGWVGSALVSSSSPSLEGRKMLFGSKCQRRLPWQQAAQQSSSLQPC